MVQSIVIEDAGHLGSITVECDTLDVDGDTNIFLDGESMTLAALKSAFGGSSMTGK